MQSGTDTWGWKHVSVFGEFDKGSGTKRWKCNHCNLRYNGSYSRVRAHLLGFTGVGIKSCPAVDAPLRESFHVLEEGRVARKRKRVSERERPVKRIKNSQLRAALVSKEDADDVVARFVYANGLNPTVVNSPYFRDLIKATASYGPSYKPPTADELCNSFLSKEKARLERSLALVRESWPQTGCSLLCVGSSDRNLGGIQICIFVSSPRGLMFLKAFDIVEFDEVENHFVDILTDVITGVGPANLLQIILQFDHGDKLSSSLDLVLTKFPHVFLSRCTSDSIRMLMEEIAEIDWIKAAIVCSKEIEQCISKYQSFAPDVFSHSLNRNSDAMASRFAPFYEMVKRVYELKELLKEAVVSDKWKEWKQSTSEDIGDTESSILEDTFWSTAELLLQSVEPFVRLLSILNMDSFVIGDVCNWRAQAFQELTHKGIKGGRANQIEELIVKRWDELFSPLHSASYILNPQYFRNAQAKDKIVMRGWKATLERYESDSSNRRVLREELSSYWRSQGSLGDEDAVDCRDKMDPVAWWENFGFEIPHLQTLAIKVLSQVSTATMCKEICQDKGFTCRETAKCLGVERVEDLAFVQNNLRIHYQKNGSRNGNEALGLE